MRQKAARATGVITHSVPPATTTSHEPSRTSRAASPMALAPAAQAVATQKFGPVRPHSMPTRPAVAFGHHHRHEQRADPRRAPLAVQRDLLLERAQAADAGAGDDAGAGRVDARRRRGRRRRRPMQHGVAGGGHAELGRAVEAAGLLEAEALLRVEVLDLAGVGDRVVLGANASIGAGDVPGRRRRVPERVGVVAGRRAEADAR